MVEFAFFINPLRPWLALSTTVLVNDGGGGGDGDGDDDADASDSNCTLHFSSFDTVHGLAGSAEAN